MGGAAFCEENVNMILVCEGNPTHNQLFSCVVELATQVERTPLKLVELSILCRAPRDGWVTVETRMLNIRFAGGTRGSSRFSIARPSRPSRLSLGVIRGGWVLGNVVVALHLRMRLAGVLQCICRRRIASRHEGVKA